MGKVASERGVVIVRVVPVVGPATVVGIVSVS